ncbi:MAG: hypothetical protein OQJ82_07570, partial [Sulfurimonas sp.]|nr:hypothetical protein [Sulfurimonas sp.]
MKKLAGIALALSLIVSSAFAEKSVMDKLTNDSAFDQTSMFFNLATADDLDSRESYVNGLVVIPVAIIESAIWVTVLPFNAIKLGMQ